MGQAPGQAVRLVGCCTYAKRHSAALLISQLYKLASNYYHGLGLPPPSINFDYNNLTAKRRAVAAGDLYYRTRNVLSKCVACDVLIGFSLQFDTSSRMYTAVLILSLITADLMVADQFTVDDLSKTLPFMRSL